MSPLALTFAVLFSMIILSGCMMMIRCYIASREMGLLCLSIGMFSFSAVFIGTVFSLGLS